MSSETTSQVGGEAVQECCKGKIGGITDVSRLRVQIHGDMAFLGIR